MDCQQSFLDILVSAMRAFSRSGGTGGIVVSSSTVKSAERALDLLSFMSSEGRPVPAMSIARRIGLPKSSTYHLLNVMRDRRFVTYYPEERLWGLGHAAFGIGEGVASRETLARLARPVLDQLALATEECALLAVLHERDVLIVHRSDGDGEAFNLAAGAGDRLPAHASAYGRAILMHESERKVRALYPWSSPLASLTGRGPRDANALRGLLSSLRSQGWASEDSDLTLAVGGVAAPVFDHMGSVRAAIGVSFWSRSYDGAGRARLGSLVRERAEHVSWRMGWHSETGIDGTAS
jgi:DNA-binding IclR family transcriptional regulator